MLCPYCRSRLTGGVSECPVCRVNFPRASALLGAVPRLATGIADAGKLLDPSGQAKVRRAIQDLCRKFPQLMIQVVLHPFPAEHAFGLHAFWLFNAASFSGDTHRGTDNHTVLIVVDPVRAEAALMVGYGLEPFVSEETLGHLLELAGPCWASNRWSDGLLTLISGLDRLFESIAAPDDSGAGEF